MILMQSAGYIEWVLLYFITFTPKCYAAFALAVAAVGVKPKAILQNKICKILQLLCRFANSAHDGQFSTKFCVCRFAEL